MRRIFYCFIVAMLLAPLVGCEKADTEVIPDEPPQVEDQSILWDFPAKLPDNIEEIVTGTPCWVHQGPSYKGVLESGNVIKQAYMLDGVNPCTYKFHTDKQLDCYVTSEFDDAKPIYMKSSWDKKFILKCEGDTLIYASRDLTDKSVFIIEAFTRGTQVYLDNLISKLSDNTEQ